ncbi:hypothetical protein EV127DRAFT_474164 [Xylaria flabelliformis]|nr:hypothetical protein EV127DRAFT_474164 [Xylaria flabelliformis]
MESTDVKSNTPGNSSDAQKPKSNSQTNSTGLVAVVVVLALLILGSAAAYLLMRRYLRKGQRNRAATTAVNDTGLEKPRDSDDDNNNDNDDDDAGERDTDTRLSKRVLAAELEAGRNEGNTTEKEMEEDDMWIRNVDWKWGAVLEAVLRAYETLDSSVTRSMNLFPHDSSCQIHFSGPGEDSHAYLAFTVNSSIAEPWALTPEWLACVVVTGSYHPVLYASSLLSGSL